MTWSKRTVLAAALVVTLAAPALAQVGGNPYEVSLNAGGMAFDTRALIQRSPLLSASVGWRATPWVTLEVPAVAAFSHSKLNTSVSQKVYYYGADLRFNLRPAENRSVPFFFAGAGYGSSTSDARVPAAWNSLGASLGLGLLQNVGSPRTYVRLQVRDMMMKDHTPEVVNDFGVTVGIHYVFGGKFKDQDLDGVRDWLDQCPNTPIGAKVDAKGCPVDSDHDGVYDGIDQCANTPHGAKVDAKGCPIDSDGDGVPDGIDQCPDTPKGATVDLQGCPRDADRDSVPDGIDQCPNTPLGAKVDGKGCPIDSDGDGVPDGIDQCPNTPAGMQVDEHGCVTDTAKREMDLTNTGMMRITHVEFADGLESIPDSTRNALAVAGAVLMRWPTLHVEIGAHTDDRGTPAANRKLSEARAKAVLAYLVERYPSLDIKRFTIKGYGGTRPIADNGTAAGRSVNQRVEFRVLDTGELMRQIKSRQSSPSGTPSPGSSPAPEVPHLAPPPAPADTTHGAPADTTKK